MAATWTWTLADQYGSGVVELWRASGRSLTFARNTFAEASCVIHHDDEDASLFFTALSAGIPTLQCFRNGVLRFNGYLAPFSEDLQEDDATVSLVFRSPFGRLLGDGNSRGRFTGPATDAASIFAAVDQGAIAKSLIDTTNLAGDTGLATTGAIATTTARDRTYNYSNVGQSIVNLSNVIGGFDFGEDFILGGSTLAQFRVYASQGGAQPNAQFQYGVDTLNNVRAVGRTTEPPINLVTIIGGNGLTGSAQDAGSRAMFGMWPYQETQSDVIVQQTLTDKANAVLRARPVRTVSFSPDPDLAPAPWDDYWLGDTAHLFGRRGSFTEDVDVRINAVTIVIDDEGNESYEIPDPLTPEGEATLRASLSVEVQE
jgi:hypothetical protein